MSEFMSCMPFSQLMTWILNEKKNRGTIFGMRRAYRPEGNPLHLFGRNLETPIGPAAGPNTQLAQNIVASYIGGSRFFEVKTVQKMDGRELAACVNKPCILAEDEGYNCEWSTELYVQEAFDEYIKAWFALHIIAKEFDLGAQDGFQFNISVGYDLAGIKTKKINDFIDHMMEAGDTPVFRGCKQWLLDHADLFENVTEEDIMAIPSDVCNSATISTLHGCPPHEIESIAKYLLEKKHLNTFVKCNPTLLGYEFARKTMDDMGYDYLVFGDFHFKDDLQYEDAVPMLDRLMKLAASLDLSFGVKITNTFPVDVTRNELPSNEMYMSGKALYPLSISLAAKLAREFDGRLRISYSGGADFFNIEKIVCAGIWPVTVATTILKPGGYHRLIQIAERSLKKMQKEWNGVDVEAIERVAAEAVCDPHHKKAIKPLPSRKTNTSVPLLDCFFAPCSEGCPIHQDIPAYLHLVKEEKYADALRVILKKNPLPFITGTICAHNCMTRCTRNFYDESEDIRGMKLLAAEKGYDEVIKEFTDTPKNGKKAAIVGAGPAGIAAAYFLLKAGVSVTLFEKDKEPGGVVRNIIPEFRITPEAIQKDISFIERMGAEIRTGYEVKSLAELKDQGFDTIILAVGAHEPGILKLEEGSALNALEFLSEFRKAASGPDLGKNVAVVGGGNTAMDTARAAARVQGVEKVRLVYRRTRRYMPAAEDELLEVMEEGIDFCELLSPVKLTKDGLVCKKTVLGEPDASGRAGVVETDELVTVPADSVIAAVGEKVPSAFYRSLGIEVTERGKAVYNKDTMETSVAGVYVIGDGAGGAATIVEGIRDAGIACTAILGCEAPGAEPAPGTEEECFDNKGVLREKQTGSFESCRCLTCNKVCENCVDVCPNRANVSIRVPGMEMAQIIHMDAMCNECGNCKIFCPYDSAPYKDKFTLFASPQDMGDSTNDGFAVLDKENCICRVRLNGELCDCKADDPEDPLYDGIRRLILTIIKYYPYLIG